MDLACFRCPLSALCWIEPDRLEQGLEELALDLSDARRGLLRSVEDPGSEEQDSARPRFSGSHNLPVVLRLGVHGTTRK